MTPEFGSKNLIAEFPEEKSYALRDWVHVSKAEKNVPVIQNKMHRVRTPERCFGGKKRELG